MDKELTVFAVDASAASTDVLYLFDTLAGKLLRGLKTDYVSVVLYHSSTTQCPDEGLMEGRVDGLEVLVDFEAPTYDTLQMLKNRLVGKVSAPSDLAQVVNAVLCALTLLAPTRKKVFTRNIVLMGSSIPQPRKESSGDETLIPNLLAEMDVNFYLVLDHADKSPYAELQALFKTSSAFTPGEAAALILNNPAIKKTRPLSVYRGEMRLNADFNSISTNPAYRAEADDLCASLRVEVFPAAKSESTPLHTHDYIIEDESGDIVKVDKVVKHYMWQKQGEPDPHEDDSDPEKTYDKVYVEPQDLTRGFKFSNFDLIALDEDLLKATTLGIFSGLDVLAMTPVLSLPLAYFTGESMYIIPEKDLLARNRLCFNSLHESLRKKDLAMLCRFVRKQEKEVELGAAMPVRVKAGERHICAYVFVRLPFKEDEKRGHFPTLNIEDEADALMDAFVNLKTSQDPLGPADVIDNFKVVMKTSESRKLTVPQNLPRQTLLASSPAVNRILKHTRQILLKLLSADDWVGFFTDPKFITNNLTAPDTSNFLNLSNCLAVNSNNHQWALDLSLQAVPASIELAEELDVKYVLRETKRQKTGDRSARDKGNYGKDEGEYAPLPDFLR